MTRISPRLAAKLQDHRAVKAERRARARTSRKPRQDPAPAKSPNPAPAADWLGPLRAFMPQSEAAPAAPDPEPADWMGPLRFLATE